MAAFVINFIFDSAFVTTVARFLLTMIPSTKLPFSYVAVVVVVVVVVATVVDAAIFLVVFRFFFDSTTFESSNSESSLTSPSLHLMSFNA